MRKPRIKLSQIEKEMAYSYAKHVFDQNKRLGIRLNSIENGGHFDNLYRGFAAECAFAKFRGVPYVPHWHTDEEIENGALRGQIDVDGFQVRSMNYKNGHYCIDEKDHDHHTFVFIYVEIDREAKDATYVIDGWCKGHEAKIKSFFKSLGGPERYWLHRECSVIKPIGVEKD
jgi:hypothetical protein